MNKDHISFVTDALLTICDDSCDARSRQPRVEPLDWLEDTQLYQAMLRGKRHDTLLANECREIYNTARLTRRQSKVLEMRLGWWTFEEIGVKRGHTRQGAQQIFLQALKKLARALRVYPYKGLSEVYQDELRRGCR